MIEHLAGLIINKNKLIGMQGRKYRGQSSSLKSLRERKGRKFSTCLSKLLGVLIAKTHKFKNFSRN